jgi:hypothetical protein
LATNDKIRGRPPGAKTQQKNAAACNLELKHSINTAALQLGANVWHQMDFYGLQLKYGNKNTAVCNLELKNSNTILYSSLQLKIWQ